ncbi:MAG: hypothetical protein NTV24_02820 [Candidatus Woesebacteria bacterium]|nr:hypothetical protein [Candidatus Woesebacteria bacterium]
MNIKAIRNNKIFKAGLAVILVSAAFIMGVGYQRVSELKNPTKANKAEVLADKSKVLPDAGFTLSISWGDLGPKLISLGVIDKDKFVKAANLNSDEEKILAEGGDVPITINADNGQFVVDLLWAIGLAQKSDAYVKGPMGTDYKKDVGNFASTGGWTLAKGKAVNYLGKYELFNLTDEQQVRVAEIAKNIYRPCCGNSTWFPDCNHGMAALAAIEMMVAKGLSNDEIYRNVLKLNSFWFPSTYMNIATYFERKGTKWDKIDAKLVLGSDYSSGQGAASIAKEVGPVPGSSGGGSCGA